jgi:hypothetical protein
MLSSTCYVESPSSLSGRLPLRNDSARERFPAPATLVSGAIGDTDGTWTPAPGGSHASVRRPTKIGARVTFLRPLFYRGEKPCRHRIRSPFFIEGKYFAVGPRRAACAMPLLRRMPLFYRGEISKDSSHGGSACIADHTEKQRSGGQWARWKRTFETPPSETGAPNGGR